MPAAAVAIAANRWFPAFLDRLVPNFSIEGEEWFREHDRRAAEEAAAVRPAAPV